MGAPIVRRLEPPGLYSSSREKYACAASASSLIRALANGIGQMSSVCLQSGEWQIGYSHPYLTYWLTGLS